MTSTNYEKCSTALTSIEKKYPQIVQQFANWYEDGGWDDESLNDEFVNDDAAESSFIDWLKEQKTIKTDGEGLAIWQLLNNAIRLVKNASIESGSDDINETKEENKLIIDLNESIVVKILTTEIAEKEKKQHIESSKSRTLKRLKVQAPRMLPDSASSSIFKSSKKNNAAQDILQVEFLGYKYKNYPLLLHFVDSYVRFQMNEWIQKGKKQENKISSGEFFNRYCVHPHFRDYLDNTHKSKATIDFVKTAIDSYQKRVLPSFQFIEPIYKINGNPLDICNYLFEIARIARNSANQPIHNFTNIIPIQIDFLILNVKIKDVRPEANKCEGVSALFDDDDEDEDEDEEEEEHKDNNDDDDDYYNNSENIPKDVNKLLKDKKIKFHIYDNPLREMLRCTEDIKRIVDNKRCKRTVFVLDRRNNKNKQNENGGTQGDKLYLFKPKKYNEFSDNDQERIHASLHHNSIMSMVPRPKSKEKSIDFNVRESLRGQMFVISYHIISKDEIRCYLFYQGQCFRFYGEDLINVLPIFFVDGKKARDIMLSKYKHEQKWRRAFDEFCNTFIDKKFDMFYHGLTGKLPRIHVLH